MAIDIRSAERTHLDSIVSIWREGVRDAAPFSGDMECNPVEFYGARLETTGVFRFFVAEDLASFPSEVLGWASLMPCRNSPTLYDSMAEMSIYVSLSSRRRGIGKLLMSSCINHARTTRLRFLISFVTQGNVGMRALAKATGWVDGANMQGSPKLPNSVPWSVLIHTVPVDH
jgi:L-amino acid N-acyltransferase YncA